MIVDDEMTEMQPVNLGTSAAKSSMRGGGIL
jgi:hypothetical protein